MWARIFMSDLALSSYLQGEIALYDIDIESVYINKKIGENINKHELCLSKWAYNVYKNIDDALKNSDVVIISILPGTFKEMYSDVHTPEKYGIYQSVGDTVGPGGVIRAMRTVPIFEFFAKKIKENSPSAWVINLTNPMTICVKTLYDVFPEIKAFGCCHEVFHTEDLLVDVVKELFLETNINRKDIDFDITGINHFTWISKAMYKDKNILDYLDEFFSNHKNGYYERGKEDDYLNDPFAYNNILKYDMYKKYRVLPAAGDRHLAEFLSNNWYLSSPENAKKWGFNLTHVDFRIKQYEERVKESKLIADNKLPIVLEKSNEEAVELIEAIVGCRKMISNVNFINNTNQVDYLPTYSIVETNCIFENDKVEPLKSGDIPIEAKNLIIRNAYNIENCYKGIKNRDIKMIFNSFINQPLCSSLSLEDNRKLFKEMLINTKDYLKDYFDFSIIDNDEF